MTLRPPLRSWNVTANTREDTICALIWELPIAPSTTATISKSYHNLLTYVRRAMDVYDELIKRGEPLHDLHVFKACCLYALCMYKEAKAECEKCQEDTPLKIRLLF